MRENKLIKILCLLLAFVLAFSSLSACNKKDKTDNNSSDSANTDDDFNQFDDGDWNDDDTDGDDYDYDDPDDGDDYDYDYDDPDDGDNDTDNDKNDNDDNDNDDDDDDDNDSTYDVDENAITAKLKVYNSTKVLNTRYCGTSASVYHCFNFITDDAQGRQYTDEMLTLELDRLNDFGIHYCRTDYRPLWCWNTVDNGWNFNQSRFQAFKNYCLEMQDRGCEIAMQVTWSFSNIFKATQNQDTPSYIGDYERADLYGESAGYDMSGMTEEQKSWTITARRLGYETALAFKELKRSGVNNIHSLWYFVEAIFPKTGYPEGIAAEKYLFTCQKIKEKLVEEGVADWVKHVGPNAGGANAGSTAVKWILERDKDLFDIVTDHHYPQASLEIDDVYYDLCAPEFEQTANWIKDAGVWDKIEYWWDEFWPRSANIDNGVDSAWIGLQSVVASIAAQQEGVDNISWWQVYDQLWPDSTQTEGEFTKGIHVTGMHPSLYVSSIPRSQWYLTGLFTRYNGYKDGTVYDVNLDYARDNGMYIGAVKLKDGNYTVTVINMGVDDITFSVDFEKAINKTLYRHTECANTVVPTTEARLAEADKTFVMVKDKFVDVIEGGTVAIYTSIKG